MDPKAICAVIVTYHPDSAFSERAKRVAAQVARVVLVDNSASEKEISVLSQVSEALHAHLIRNEFNVGIAKALNQGAGWARTEGFSWILTLDQDSVVFSNMVQSLIAVHNRFNDDSRLAIIGSNYICSRSGKPFSEARYGPDTVGREVKFVITSGSLVSLHAFDLLGGFREEFFIDRVDHEYCFRARSRGFRVVMSSDPLMEHPVGDGVPCGFLWWRTETSNHAAVRRYFMARNEIAIVKEHLWKEPICVLRNLSSFLKSTVLMFLFERSKSEKVKYTMLGIFDGLFGDFRRRPI